MDIVVKLRVPSIQASIDGYTRLAPVTNQSTPNIVCELTGYGEESRPTEGVYTRLADAAGISDDLGPFELSRESEEVATFSDSGYINVQNMFAQDYTYSDYVGTTHYL